MSSDYTTIYGLHVPKKSTQFVLNYFNKNKLTTKIKLCIKNIKRARSAAIGAVAAPGKTQRNKATMRHLGMLKAKLGK